MKYKFKQKQNQNQILLEAFAIPRTMLQVARKTGIERASICYRLAELQDKNRIQLVGYGLCPITKHRAGFYETIEKSSVKI